MKTTRSTSEVGHGKNVTNFVALIEILSEMGATYNPANGEISIANLTTLRDSAIASIQNLSDQTPAFKNAVSNRENAYKPLGKLVTRAQNSFKSLALPQSDKDNVIALVKKIRGIERPKKAEGLEKESNETISNAQLSYDSKAANLQKLVSLLESHPEYTPNESEIKPSSLDGLYDELIQFNLLTLQTGNALITARKQRNDVLYKNPTNVLDLVMPIKNYLKSVDGAQDYYKAAVRLKFKERTNG